MTAPAGAPLPNSADCLLDLRQVSVRRGLATLLNDTTLGVERGARVGVWGPNGAGKSTLLQVIALLLQPTSGEIWLSGERVDNRRDVVAVRRRMAVLFQEPLLFDMTVTENIATGLRFRGVPAGQRRTRVEHWIERLGLGAVRHQPARTLSGGEAHRASLARAMVLEPELLLLDEPFGSLDYATHARLIDDLPALLAENNCTAIIVSHNPRDLSALCTTAIALEKGQIVRQGSPAGIIQAGADGSPTTRGSHHG